MGASNLIVKRDEGQIIATLNRPEKLNALNKDLFDELDALVEVLDTDKTARVLILTGSGEKAFCVGPDLKERQGMNEKDILARVAFVRQLYLRFGKLPIPIIAAIEGIALGEGLELALACDLRVASSSASLGFPEVDLGIIPGNGGTQRLARVVGMGRAMELILLARRMSAKEALQVGIVHQVVAAGESLKQASKWAKKMMESGPLAICQAKRAIRSGWGRSLEEGLELEAESYKQCLRSKDRLEGLKAFVEKRAPNYGGH